MSYSSYRPTVSLTGPGSITEGDSGASLAAFTVTLSSAGSVAVKVGYRTSNGSATSGSDYASTRGTLTIAAGATSGVIYVPVYGDTTYESDETFGLTLTSTSKGTLASSSKSAVTTLVNDDAVPPTVSLTGPSSVTEGDSGSSVVTYTLSLSSAAATDVAVVYATSNGTATTGDYASTSGTMTIAAGATSGTIDIPIYGDTVYEGNETFSLSLSSATNATVSSTAKSVITTITNDEAVPPTVSLTGPASLVEGNSGSTDATYTVSLSAASATDVKVVYATSNGTATAGSDYASTSGTLTIAAGATSGTIAVPVYGDATYESNETLTLTLSSATNGILSSTAKSLTTTITDDEPVPPTVTLAGTTTCVEGNSGTTDALYTVSLSAATTTDVKVVYATSNISATAGSDYVSTSGILTIAAGATSGTIAVPVYGDATYESDETFKLSLSSATDALLSSTLKSVTTTLSNDDTAPPTVSLTGPTSVTEGNSDSTSVTYTVSLSAASASDVAVVYSTTSISATAGRDYATTMGTLTIAAGATSGTIEVPVYGDTSYESSERFKLSLTSATNATLSTTAKVVTTSITNDDSRSRRSMISEFDSALSGLSAMRDGWTTGASAPDLDTRKALCQEAAPSWGLGS